MVPPDSIIPIRKGLARMKERPVILLSLVVVAGCSTHPNTNAVCLSECLATWDNVRVLVWSNEPTIEPLLAQWVKNQGGEVIDPAIVRQSMRRNDQLMGSSSAVERSLRELGRIVGADKVLAAAVERRSYPLYYLYSGYKEGHPHVTTVFDPTVTIRSMSVADDTTQWSVTARGASTSFVYGPAVTELAETALERAACEANRHRRWTDDRGCTDTSQSSETHFPLCMNVDRFHPQLCPQV